MTKLISHKDISIQDITAIVATREREIPLHHMVTSFHKYYPKLKIVAVDSSERPNKRKDILHLFVPSDSGISEPRNMALQEVKTPLFLLLDDDYVCTSKTDIKKLMSQVINGASNIAGGAVNNIGSEQYDFHGCYNIIGDILYHFVDRKDPLSNQYNTIFNFFVGDTNKVQDIGGWDTELKYAREHDDFFLMMKERKMLVSYDNLVSVDHYHYPKYHGGICSKHCVEHFLSKWGIRNKVEVRLIQKPGNDPYISYHNCIVDGNYIEENIWQQIQSIYGNYPIKISGNG